MSSQSHPASLWGQASFPYNSAVHHPAAIPYSYGEKKEEKLPTGVIRLNSGHLMPLIGLGTWKAGPGEVGAAVTLALESGYRHIDCAAVYGNEKEIGTALAAVFAKGVIRREDVFITSKLWNTNHDPVNVLPALKQTLADLQLKYLDLYLVHHPTAWQFSGLPPTSVRPVDKDGIIIFEKVTLEQTWKAMEKLVPTGLVRSIGVSNYKLPQLVDLLAYATIIPAVNQVEVQPMLVRTALVEQSNRWGIHTSAYSALGSNTAGAAGPLNNQVIISLGAKYSRTPAQIIIRWLTQRGLSVLPKSTKIERIRENLGVYDFTITTEDMAAIAALNTGTTFVPMALYWKFDMYEA